MRHIGRSAAAAGLTTENPAQVVRVDAPALLQVLDVLSLVVQKLLLQLDEIALLRKALSPLDPQSVDEAAEHADAHEQKDPRERDGAVGQTDVQKIAPTQAVGALAARASPDAAVPANA